MTIDPTKIPPGVQVNFALLKQAFSKGNVCVVVCRDQKGARYNVICSLNSITDENGGDAWQYAPFAIMVGSSIRPIMDELIPPSNLKGHWHWPPTQRVLPP